MKDSKKATLLDVAKRADVSIATISRVLHDLPVRAATRVRVEAAIAELGYSPNLAARALRTNSSQTIACSTRLMLRSQLSPLLSAIERTARDAGFTLILTAAQETIEGQQKTMRFLASRGIDGLIFAGAIQHDPALMQGLKGLNIPVMFLDRDPVEGIDAAIVAHAHATEAAVDHLHSLGHQKIALLTIPSQVLPGRDRIAGFKKAMRARKLKVRPEWLSENCVDDRTTFQQASYLLSMEDRPTAVIAGGVSVLPSVLRAARERGLVVGRDLSVIAGCDSELAELCSPAITATRWNMEEYGRVATQMLIERIRDPEVVGGRLVTIPTELVVRGSTKPPAASGKR